MRYFPYHMNPKIAVAVGLVAVFASIFALPQTAFAADVNVSITAGATSKTTNAYDPNPVEANVGDKVIWTNSDSTPHTATSGQPGEADGMFGGEAGSFGTIIPPQGKQEFTFTEAGEFPYYCGLHPNMVGTVTVAAGGNGDGGQFTVTPTVDGQPATANGQPIEVTGEGAKATAITVNTEAKSIDVTFEGAGEVELTLPTDLISGINSVMAGDQTVEFTQEGEEITFTVPEGATTVTIAGATVVPEFPVTIVLILAVTMVAIIGYTRYAKSGNNFFGRA
jgi:plastocyanin